MSSGEIVLTLVVTVVVLGPKKLPMVAYHLGKLYNRINRYRAHFMALWQQQINEHQLLENTKKAQQADTDYQQKL